MRILFMGTPDYAIPTLEKLYLHHNIVGIVTRIDKPNRRGNKIQFSPVKEFAIAHNIPLFQPKSLSDPNLANEFLALKPDIAIVVAFGMMVPDNIINLPPNRTINIHGSLLPRYRGAAPMQYTILNGDTQAGVSIMYITNELDAGDIILTKAIAVDENETYGELHDKLAILGAEALIEALNQINLGTVHATQQDPTEVTYAPQITKSECIINWSLSARILHNRVRGLSPNPGAYTYLPNKKRLIVSRTERIYTEYSGNPGEVVDVIKKKGPVILTGKDGALCITLAKPEGKREMPGIELVNGHYLSIGDILSDYE